MKVILPSRTSHDLLITCDNVKCGAVLQVDPGDAKDEVFVYVDNTRKYRFECPLCRHSIYRSVADFWA